MSYYGSCGCGCGNNSNQQVSLSDRFKYCSSENSDERSDSFSSLLSLFSNSFTSDFVSQFKTNKYVPEEGDTIILEATGGNLRNFIKPAGTLSAITIKLPQATGDAAVVKDKQRLMFFSTQIIGGITYDLNGASEIRGLSLTSYSVDESFTIIYDAEDNIWYEQR